MTLERTLSEQIHRFTKSQCDERKEMMPKRLVRLLSDSLTNAERSQAIAFALGSSDKVTDTLHLPDINAVREFKTSAFGNLSENVNHVSSDDESTSDSSSDSDRSGSDDSSLGAEDVIRVDISSDEGEDDDAISDTITIPSVPFTTLNPRLAASTWSSMHSLFGTETAALDKSLAKQAGVRKLQYTSMNSAMICRKKTVAQSAIQTNEH